MDPLPSILLRETNHRRKNLLLVLFPVLAIGKRGKRGRVRRDISWLTASCYFCFRQTQKSSQTVRGTSAKGCHFFVGELSTFIWSERASLTLLLSSPLFFHTNPHFLSGLGSTCHTSFFWWWGREAPRRIYWPCRGIIWSGFHQGIQK